MSLIELENISKSYKKNVLFKNVNIKFEKGKIYGLTGPNGCGKSVLFKILAGFVLPDEGIVKINGEVLNKENRFPTNFGIVINGTGYLADRTGFQNLKYLAMINNKISDEIIKETMVKVGLDPELKTKVKDYSLGMQQKLGICQAIMENQSVLLLDEPFNALDKKSVNNIRTLLLNLNKNGRTIFLTSHNQADIDALCNMTYEINDYNLELC